MFHLECGKSLCRELRRALDAAGFMQRMLRDSIEMKGMSKTL